MSETRVPLTPAQKEILTKFYSRPLTHILYSKKERTKIWNSLKKERVKPSLEFEREFPSLVAEIEKSLQNGKYVQSGIFSECVYAQTLAKIFELNNFYNCASNPEVITETIAGLLESHNLTARYLYASNDKKKMLVQAGGNAGVDAAYIDLNLERIYTIEFKEAISKISEPDLPLYEENGFLVVTEEFIEGHSHYEMMIKQQLEKKLNFWKVMGSNVNDFEIESVKFAIAENYAKDKFAEVICVEDKNGMLAMIPANQVVRWTSKIKGEIRPAGRNNLQPWTPLVLKELILAKKGKISGDEVSLPITSFRLAKGRGAGAKISRYKLSPIFYLEAKDVKRNADTFTFRISDVRQLKPTISAHMYFRKLDVNQVAEYYRQEF